MENMGYHRCDSLKKKMVRGISDKSLNWQNNYKAICHVKQTWSLNTVKWSTPDKTEMLQISNGCDYDTQYKKPPEQIKKVTEPICSDHLFCFLNTWTKLVFTYVNTGVIKSITVVLLCRNTQDCSDAVTQTKKTVWWADLHVLICVFVKSRMV